jgi:hypothetical protein
MMPRQASQAMMAPLCWQSSTPELLSAIPGVDLRKTATNRNALGTSNARSMQAGIVCSDTRKARGHLVAASAFATRLVVKEKGL